MVRTPLRFGRAGHLVGILHEPQEEIGSDWGILLWNTGISNRTGPFGLNLALAEVLVKQGHTVLRFDLSRLGDSTDPGETGTLQERTNRDLADAIKVLKERYGLQQFLLIGVCSSAVDAFYYAVEDSSVRAVIMIDGFVYGTTAHFWRYLWHRGKDPRRWMRFLQRKIFGSKTQLPEVNDYFEANYPAVADARRGVERLLARGSSLLVLYTGGFHAYFSYPSQFHEMLEAPRFEGDLEVHHWPKVDHLFSLLEDREQFLALVDQWASRTLRSRPRESPRTLANTGQRPDSPVEEKRRHHVEYFAPGQSPILALEAPVADSLAAAAYQAKALEVFKTVLYRTDFAESDNFFEFGGTSVLAIKAATLLSENLGFPVSVLWIYECPCATDLGQKLCSAQLPDFENQGAQSFRDQTSAQTNTVPDPLEDAIAIIGIACHVPGARNWREFWANICAGRETVTHFRPEELDPTIPLSHRHHPQYVAARGIIEGERFDHQFFGISKREAEFADPQQRILLETAWQALEDAGYSKDRQKIPIAVYAGTANSSYMNRNIMQGHASAFSEEEFLATLWNDKDYVATRIAHTLDLRGPAVSVHTACSTSLVAVIEAIKCLRSGDAAIALAGGAAINAPIAAGHVYQEGSIFSRDGHCRPFAADATGTMFSDGAAMLVLRPLKAAEAAGDHIYAVIRGWGLNNDGAKKTSFAAPSLEGQAQAIREAYRRAQWSPSTLGYMEAHGTGTPIGDPIEVEALRRTFYELDPSLKQRAAGCALGSVKALVGHLTAAAGAIGLIKAALAISQQKIPPQILHGPENPELRLEQSPFYLPNELVPWTDEIRRAGVSSLGVGGTNAHVLLEQAPPAKNLKPQVDAPLDPWIVLAWSAKDEATCKRYGESLMAHLPESPEDMAAYAAMLHQHRENFPWHQAILAWDRPSFERHSSHIAAPIHRGEDPQLTTRPVVWLFAGQGSQYPQMGRELARRWPRFAFHYASCLELFAQHGLTELKAMLLDSQHRLAADIQETAYTQPAIFSYQWALGQCLLELGIPVHGALGHSIGEYAAACLAGVMTREEAAKLVYARAQAMASAAPGAMLAVRAEWEQIAEDLPTGLALAAVNAPRAIVVAGPEAEIDQAIKICRKKGIASRKLETSRAFHSPMMDPILDRFRDAFAGVRLLPPRWQLISSVDAQPLLADRAQSPDYWIDQIRQPVRFADAVRACEQQQALYLDIGPRDILAKLLPSIIGSSGVSRTITICKASESGSEPSALAHGLGQLWSHGHQWAIPPVRQKLSVPAYPFYGDKSWLSPQRKELNNPEPSTLPRSLTPRADILSQLIQLLSELSGLPASSLMPSHSWNELGLDSLLMTQWALKIQKQWHIQIKIQDLQSPVESLEKLAAHIQQLRPDLKEKPVETNPPAALEEHQDWPSISQLFQQQLDIMQQQLKLFERWDHLAHSTAAPADSAVATESDGLWDRLEQAWGPPEWETHFTDEGPCRLPRWPGSRLFHDKAGKIRVIVEDPQNKGQFYTTV